MRQSQDTFRTFAYKAAIAAAALTLCAGLATASTTIGNDIQTAGNLTVGGVFGIATTSPGSLFSIGGVANFTTGTSTLYASGGINLAGGCFAVNGTCVGSSGGSSNGIVKLASGTLGPSTAFVDIVLPSGYEKFDLELQGVQADTEDNLTYRFSSELSRALLNFVKRSLP
jgi:hypothetical protein